MIQALQSWAKRGSPKLAEDNIQPDTRHGVILYVEYLLLLNQAILSLEQAQKAIRRMISQLLALAIKR